jgi:hypothetical protein
MCTQYYCDSRLIRIKFLDAALELFPFTLVSISRDLHDVVFPYDSVFPLNTFSSNQNYNRSALGSKSLLIEYRDFLKSVFYP